MSGSDQVIDILKLDQTKRDDWDYRLSNLEAQILKLDLDYFGIFEHLGPDFV